MATKESVINGLASAVTTWGTSLTGTTMTFTNASAAVVGVATLFTTELAINDYVIGADGVWYQVLLITDNLNLTLTGLYAGTTGSPTRKYKQVTAVPADGDKVNIYNTVTLDAAAIQWGDDTTTAVNVKSGGILKASRTATHDLRVKGSLIVESGGELDTGKPSDAIPATYISTLKLNHSAAIAQDKYSLTILSGGKWFSQGTPITRTTLLNGALSIGGTSAVLDDVTGWAVGDEVVFSSTTAVATGLKTDKRTIATINTGTKTITFTALTNAHADRCEVGNFGGNVFYTSATPNTTTSQGYITAALANTANIHDIQYTSFAYLGHSQPAITFNGGGVNTNLVFKHNAQYDCRGTSTGVNFFCNSPFTDINDCIAYNVNAINASGADWGFLAGAKNMILSNSVGYGRNQAPHISSGNSQGGVGITCNDCKFLGANTGFGLGPGFNFTFNRCYWYGMATAVFTSGYSDQIVFNNCYLGYGGVGSRNIRSVFLSGTAAINQAILNDCYFNYSVSFLNGTFANMIPASKIIVANKNVDPTLQEIYTTGGNLFRDNSVYKAGSASMRYDGISSTTIASNSWYIFAPTGKAVSVTCYLRKNTSYGSSTLPYIQLSGLGITDSTATMTNVDDTWVQVTVQGTQTTGTDGMLTLTAYFQSSAASASAWIDEISAVSSAAVNSGGLEYWAAGQPAQVIAANYVAPIDVWNVLKTQTTLTGSMGEEVNKIKQIVTGLQ